MENNQELKPSYYSITPALVRYSTEISDGAKILYGEISCLCNREGYCWANNTYFSKLYSVDSRTIQRRISELHGAGFIRLTINKGTGFRKMWIIGVDKNVLGGVTKMSYPPDKNVTHNSKTNTKKNTIAETSSADAPFSLLEERKKLDENKRRALNIISLYMEYRDKSLRSKITNKAQMSLFIKRHISSATELEKAEYSDDQIIDAFDAVQSKYKDIDWTLETIKKELTK